MKLSSLGGKQEQERENVRIKVACDVCCDDGVPSLGKSRNWYPSIGIVCDDDDDVCMKWRKSMSSMMEN